MVSHTTTSLATSRLRQRELSRFPTLGTTCLFASDRVSVRYEDPKGPNIFFDGPRDQASPSRTALGQFVPVVRCPHRKACGHFRHHAREEPQALEARPLSLPHAQRCP